MVGMTKAAISIAKSGGRRAVGAGVLALVAALTLAACSSSSTPSAKAKSTTHEKPTTTYPSLTVDGATVTYDPTIAGTLPSSMRDGNLRDISYNAAFPDEGIENGQLTGWEIQLGKAIATVLGMHWTATPSAAFTEFIPDLQDGRDNVSFTSFIYTPARVKVINIVGFYETGTMFATKSNSTIVVRTLTDLCNHTVAVIAGSSYIAEINGVDATCRSHSEAPPTLKAYPTQPAAALAVSSGRVQVFATSAGQMGYYLSQTGHEFTEDPLELAPVPEGVGITKGLGLTRPIAEAFNHLVVTGAYDQIMHHWGVKTGLVTHALVFK